MSEQESPMEDIVLNIIEDPEEWAKYQAEHEAPEEEREQYTADAVKIENTEAKEVE